MELYRCAHRIRGASHSLVNVVFHKFINIPFVVSLSNHECNTLKKLALRPFGRLRAQSERPM
jgi:hypothetical protein